jgi:hypothetical protein
MQGEMAGTTTHNGKIVTVVSVQLRWLKGYIMICFSIVRQAVMHR